MVWKGSGCKRSHGVGGRPTLCSSCLTSRTVPSWKVHLTTSVSSWESTASLPFRAVQNFWKSRTILSAGSQEGGVLGLGGLRLMKCQTWLRGALMTELSTTEVEVGIAVDMVAVGESGVGSW